MDEAMKNKGRYKLDTQLAHLGRDSAKNHGIVNPPVYHASTILYPSLDAVRSLQKPLRKGATQYGRAGTPTTFAFEETVASLEGGYGAIAMPSGLAAIAGTYAALMKTGDHVLVSDSVYQPNRAFCEGPMKDLGVEAEFYDPRIGADIAALLRPNTRLVFVESPGSLTFEVQDLPAISAAAHAMGVLVVADNTWASPVFCRALDLGADVVVHAATKYLVGHADAMLGVIVTATEDLFTQIRARTQRFGYCVGPDDLYLGLRGVRTLSVRMARHNATALRLAQWLDGRPEVERVFYPALPEDPGHDLWKRDFSGASGLFGLALKPCTEGQLAAFLDGMELFGMGFSWGGFESLCLASDPGPIRSAVAWKTSGPCLRIHAGLEDPEDLMDDLDAAFRRLRGTSYTKG
jgi:cystathionine beta-lyase